MKNKFLIKLYVANLDENYELFIPVNETIKKVVDLIVKSVNDLSDGALNMEKYYHIINPETREIYKEASIVRDTDIKNGKKVILI